MAVVKKDTFETIARQATELGVTSIVPILSARSEKKNLNMERLQAIVTEAAEQSGRGTVPTIEAICSFDEALQKTSAITNIVASLRVQAHSVSDTSTCALWIGPEGGWTEEEEETFAEKGFISLRLTETTLKADTAAVAALTSILATTW
jgi:16S rRNA (uracil1498-N3)-methyltransferase